MSKPSLNSVDNAHSNNNAHYLFIYLGWKTLCNIKFFLYNYNLKMRKTFFNNSQTQM